MRVALDVTPLAGPRTGIGTFVSHVLDALAALDDAPDVQPWALTARGGAQLPGGVRRFPYPARLALGAWGRIGHPDGRRTLRGADLVHGTNFVAPPTGSPTVITVHDLSFVETRPAFVPVVRRLVALGAWVHAPSAAVADAVRATFATERAVAVHHGPTVVGPEDPTVVLPDLPAGTPFVLAIGTAEPRKNLPALVRAFASLHAAHPELHLVLAGARAGDPAEQERIDRVLDASPPDAARQVHQLEHVAGRARDALLRRATVLAYPSLDEGFGFPLLEAMQVGVPVVAAQVPAIAEVAGDAAALVPPDDAEALAGALSRAVSDDAARARLVALGYENVGRFSWDRCARELLALYRQAR